MPGSGNQLALGLALQFFTALLYLYFSPYREDSDDRLQMVCQIEIHLAMLYALFAQSAGSGSGVWLLVFMIVMPFVTLSTAAAYRHLIHLFAEREHRLAKKKYAISRKSLDNMAIATELYTGDPDEAFEDYAPAPADAHEAESAPFTAVGPPADASPAADVPESAASEPEPAHDAESADSEPVAASPPGAVSSSTSSEPHLEGASFSAASLSGTIAADLEKAAPPPEVQSPASASERPVHQDLSDRLRQFSVSFRGILLPSVEESTIDQKRDRSGSLVDTFDSGALMDFGMPPGTLEAPPPGLLDAKPPGALGTRPPGVLEENHSA